jgi:hypothetical protein
VCVLTSVDDVRVVFVSVLDREFFFDGLSSGHDHVAAECSHRGRDRDAGQMACDGACEAVDRVGDDLDGQLAAVVHGIEKGVAAGSLHELLGCIAGSQQVHQDARQHALVSFSGDKEVAAWGLDVFVGGKVAVFGPEHVAVCAQDDGFRKQRRVAQVVCDHDRGIQRCKVEGCDGLVVVAGLGCDDGCALVVVAAVLFAAALGRRHEDAFGLASAQQLRQHADLLSARQHPCDRDARHACHLDVVDDDQQLVEQTLRQTRVLETVCGQSAACVCAGPVSVVQHRDQRVVHVFLLLLEKMGRHVVQRVAGEFVVALYRGQHIELHTAVDVDVFAFACAVCLGRKRAVFHGGRVLDDAAQVRKHIDAEGPCSVQQVRQVEVDDVVAGQDVWVHGNDKVAPLLEHADFVFAHRVFSPELMHVCADDAGTRAQREHILDDRLRLALDRHAVGNLDHRVVLCLGEMALSSGTLDVKAQDAQRRHAAPLGTLVWRVRDQMLVADLDLDLAVCCLLAGLQHAVFVCRQLQPVAADDVLVDHGPQHEHDVALVRRELSACTQLRQTHACLEQLAQRADEARHARADADKALFLVELIAKQVRQHLDSELADVRSVASPRHLSQLHLARQHICEPA